MRVLAWMITFASLMLISVAGYAQGQSGRVDITGEAVVEIADFFEEDRSELYYFILDKQTNVRTQLFFPTLPGAAFKSGARVRIRGISRDSGKGINVENIELIEAAPDPFGAATPDGEPVSKTPVATARTRKVLTLLVSFLDAVVDTGTANGVTPQIITDRMFNETKNVQHFYDLASLGTLSIPTDPNGIGKEPVFGPYTINYNYLTVNGGTCIANTWANAALTLWEADTVGNPAGETRSDYDSWSIIVPNYWDYSGRACTWGGYAGVGCTQCWAFSADPASILHGVVIHELGHNFGFGHARFDSDNDGLSDCEYCDSSDMMGGSRNWMKFNSVHFNYQGWWDPASYDIDTVTPSSTEQEFDLLPVDEEDSLWPGLRAVKTPRTASTHYFFSFRQQTGHYNNVTSSYTTGVNIHWGNSGNYSYFYRMLEPGQVFYDATQDLVVWALGETTVDVGGETTDVFTIKLCNSSCSSLWPAFNLAASGISPNTIRLTWEDNTYNEDGWRIDYSLDGTAWSELTTIAANSTSHNHNGLAAGATVFYRIQAYRGASETSDWSTTVSATTPPASGVFGFPIISGDDDTIEYTGPYTGQMYPDWTYLWLGYDSGNSATNDEGLRFQNVTIPQDATINSAYIHYYAYSSASGDTSIRFRTEDVDNAAPFTTATGNLTSRSFGTAYVDWTLPTSWTSGSAQQSPNLAAVVQPIVNREGWGGGNSMVFITQGNPDFPAGNHRVRSYNYGSSWAPVLEVDYTWTPPGPVAPVASFDYTTYSLDATFTDTSTDSDGNVVGWSWDFGDTNTSTLQHPVHTYASSNTYTVGLTVLDNDGETNYTSQSVTVSEDTQAPVITVLGDDPALVGQFDTYTDAGATATDNLDGDLTGSIGTTGLPVDTGVTGDVTVNYSVFDGSGNEGTASRTVTVVANQAPIAAFMFSATGLSVDYTDDSSDTDGSIAAWSWDFGDGGSSNVQNPTHVYANDGSYTVMLTVTDDDGLAGPVSHSVNLLVAPDSLAARPIAVDSINLSWNDNSSIETGFVIERSPGGAGSWLQIGSVGAGVAMFNDSADLNDGSSYDYRVRATGPGFDSSWSNVESVTTFACSSSKTFTGGEWYQFALACDPGPFNTVGEVFTALQPLVYGFDASNGTYTQLKSADTLVPGTGYWVNFFLTTAFSISGYDTVNADIPLVSDAVNGRNNLAGFSGNGTVAWPDVLVVDGAQTKTLLEADPWETGANPVNRVCDLPGPTNKCLMSRKLQIWGGTTATGAYQVYDPDVPGQEGMLVPLDGLWVKAFKSGVKLRIPDPVAPAPEAALPAPLARAAPDGKKGKGKGLGKDKKNQHSQWYVRLVAESGSLRDPGNTLGHKDGSVQGQDARDLEEPAPFAGVHLSILFTNPLFDARPWGFTTDFRAPANSPAGDWPFVVRASSSSAPITLSWEADAFEFTDTWLVDQQSGERIKVRSGGSYTFTPVARESSFVFVIE